ncbi:MAG: FecR domain-containing protein [Planctomycetota bacterium]
MTLGDRDDYLWDPQQPPDPEIEALERALRPLRRTAPPPGVELLPTAVPRRSPWRRALPAAVAAAALLALWLVFGGGEAALRPGSAPRQFVADESPLVVRLGALAEVTLRPGADLQFAHWRDDEARLRLRLGTVEVRVAPPPAVAPRFFCIDTPGGEVVDLGCRYRLQVHDDGRQYVRVTEGMVEFAFGGRTVLVPAGAECSVVDGVPSTPVFVDLDGRLRDLAAKFDAALRQPGVPIESRWRVAQGIAERCRTGRDTLILWHLLGDADPVVREVAEARLLELEGPPPGAVLGPGKQPVPHADAGTWLPFLRQGAWSRPQ